MAWYTKFTQAYSTGKATFRQFRIWIENAFDDIETNVNAIFSDYKAKNKIIYGKYVGDGTAERIIDIGVTPSTVFVYRKRNPQFEGSYGDYYNYGGMALSDTNSKGVQSIENGFKVFANKLQLLYTNQSNETYMYIAIVGGERKDIG